MQFQNTKPFLATTWVNSKFSAALNSFLQIFTDLISWKEKQMKRICRITCLKEDVLVVFPTGFDMKHDLESDKISSSHWVVLVSPLKYTQNLLLTSASQQRSWSRNPRGMDRGEEVKRSLNLSPMSSNNVVQNTVMTLSKQRVRLHFDKYDFPLYGLQFINSTNLPLKIVSSEAGNNKDSF